MFSDCSSLSKLDLSNSNTSQVTNMSLMFNECYSLLIIRIYKFYSLVIHSILNLDLSSFNTQNATNMSFMLNECSSLLNLYLSNFNTQNVTNMEHMYALYAHRSFIIIKYKFIDF